MVSNINFTANKANTNWQLKSLSQSKENSGTQSFQNPSFQSKVGLSNLQAYFLPFSGKILKHDAREWLETNGGGAYSSSTVSGANTRVYHGALVSSFNQPVDRNVLLSRVDEEIEINGKEGKYLSEVAYGNEKLKRGGKTGDEVSDIKSFKVLPVPTWEYDTENGTTLTKQIAMPHDEGKGKVTIGYTYNAPEDAPSITLKLKPIFNYRDFHSNQNGVTGWSQDKQDNKVLVGCRFGDYNVENRPAVSWDNPNATYKETNSSYGNFYYEREDDRGLSPKENGLYNPGVVEVTLKPGESISLTASPEDINEPVSIKDAVKDKEQYLQNLYDQSGLPQTETFKMLQRAADQFIVHRNSVDGPTILAGYHWFNDWGRDTMIALPGCTLTTKRFDEAKGILKTFAQYAKNGMLPNNFPNQSGVVPGYNTSDASMWWFNALNSYATEAGKEVDKPFVKEQYQELKKVVDHHLYGRHSGAELLANNKELEGIIAPGQAQKLVGNGDKGLGMEADGLIHADNGQLTWMDASPDGITPFTPREGKAVEINALWYNGLCIMRDLATEFGEPKEAEKYDKLSKVVKESMKQFWNPDTKCLNDLVGVNRGPCKIDSSIRPNQIIALALPHRAFEDNPEQEKSILNVVKDKLLTPYGLKSLSEDNHNYAPYYPNSGPAERDPVYHQGTVWGWLIGPYADAVLNVKDGSKKDTKEEVYEALKPIIDHMKGQVDAHANSGSCIGGIAEIYDATAPYHSKGTVNQAWSVSEALRIMDKIQDVVPESK